jgi:hypothetical protein
VPSFTVIDLSAQCEVLLQAEYEYRLLEQVEGAAQVLGAFASEIWRAPEKFELPLRSIPADTQLVFHFAATSDSSGVAWLRDPERTLLISMLVSGIDPTSDRLTLEAFQRFAVGELHDSGFEPSFEMLEIPQRPLAATVGLFPPQQPSDRWLFSLADRCFAAAYFRRLGLV